MAQGTSTQTSATSTAPTKESRAGRAGWGRRAGARQVQTRRPTRAGSCSGPSALLPHPSPPRTCDASSPLCPHGFRWPRGNTRLRLSLETSSAGDNRCSRLVLGEPPGTGRPRPSQESRPPGSWDGIEPRVEVTNVCVLRSAVLRARPPRVTGCRGRSGPAWESSARSVQTAVFTSRLPPKPGK